jgi:hypothetical protein
MKNVLIIGTGGSLAASVIAALKKVEDVHHTLFLRNKRLLPDCYLSNATIVEGDVMDYSVLKEPLRETRHQES